jgi:oxygen-independent coproporphyrinogen-3 oxidase
MSTPTSVQNLVEVTVLPVDRELLRRYDVRGPRYTSYPPAPVFSAAYDVRQFELDLIRTNHESIEPLSLYINIPFCDTLCYFCGCTTIITPNHTHATKYVDYIRREIENVGRYINRDRKVIQLQWGGGTPTFLSPEEITSIVDMLRENFTFDIDIEAGVEIDPRGLRREQLVALRENGFNRISLGVQDFDDNVQQAVNRVQSEELVRTVIDWCRELGFTSVNVDLIYGLPLQTVESFGVTIDKIIELSPDRIAAYNYAHVPWLKPHQKLIRPEDLPNADGKLAILAMTIDRLTGAGYRYIGMDHFAKADDELSIARDAGTLHRNFQGYSTKAGADLLAFGMASISNFGGVYAQNAKTLTEYYAMIEKHGLATVHGHRMTADDHIRNTVIMDLMCKGIAVKDTIGRKYGIEFDDYFGVALTRMEGCVADSLVTNDPDALRILPQGWYFLRNVAMCFDAYLDELLKQEKLFSRTV